MVSYKPPWSSDFLNTFTDLFWLFKTFLSCIRAFGNLYNEIAFDSLFSSRFLFTYIHSKYLINIIG